MSEVDPLGKNQHESGAKMDAGKTRCSLVLGAMSRAVRAVSEVGTFGANKYSDDGWVDVPKGIERYTDAMLRHYLDEQLEVDDRESKLKHAAHLAWNAMARLELMIRENS